MSPPGNPHVVIAGAGPVGLTLALLLGAKDISVTVLEAEDKISEELRASTFHPPTLDMLAPYGITDRMLEQGTRVSHLAGAAAPIRRARSVRPVRAQGRDRPSVPAAVRAVEIRSDRVRRTWRVSQRQHSV